MTSRGNVAYKVQNCTSRQFCPTELVSLSSPHLNHTSVLSSSPKH